MKIETKYNLGQEVWMIYDNRAIKAFVVGYRFSYGIGDYYGSYSTGDAVKEITYCLKGGDMTGCMATCEEYELFPTKEELLKSL